MRPTPAQLKILRKVKDRPRFSCDFNRTAADACRRRRWIVYSGEHVYNHYIHITAEGRRALEGGR